MKLRNKINNLTMEIAASVDHGECFYEKDMLEDFLSDLDELKSLAVKYYDENKEE